MAWFQKKTEEKNIREIPKLPELPNSEELVFPSNEEVQIVPSDASEDTLKVEVQGLPPLPDFESENKAPPERIKPAVRPLVQMQKSRFAPPGVEKSNVVLKMARPHRPMNPEGKYKSNTLEINPSFQNGLVRPVLKEVEPVYIRLDKFETTVEAFEEIKNKIIEIETTLKKTQEIKQKETQELDEWEKEIQIIKSRIDFIDKNIFNKLD